jgi:hypothetical protein
MGMVFHKSVRQRRTDAGTMPSRGLYGLRNTKEPLSFLPSSQSFLYLNVRLRPRIFPKMGEQMPQRFDPCIVIGGVQVSSSGASRFPEKFQI